MGYESFLNRIKTDKKFQIFMGVGLLLVVIFVVYGKRKQAVESGGVDKSLGIQKYTKGGGGGTSGNDTNWILYKVDEARKISDYNTDVKLKASNDARDKKDEANKSDIISKISGVESKVDGGNTTIATLLGYATGLTQRMDNQDSRISNIDQKLTQSETALQEYKNRPVLIATKADPKPSISEGIKAGVKIGGLFTGNNGVGYNPQTYTSEFLQSMTTQDGKNAYVARVQTALNNRTILGQDTKAQMIEYGIATNFPTGGTIEDYNAIAQQVHNAHGSKYVPLGG